VRRERLPLVIWRQQASGSSCCRNRPFFGHLSKKKKFAAVAKVAGRRAKHVNEILSQQLVEKACSAGIDADAEAITDVVSRG
jgi:hypothetical protein